MLHCRLYAKEAFCVTSHSLVLLLNASHVFLHHIKWMDWTEEVEEPTTDQRGQKQARHHEKIIAW